MPHDLDQSEDGRVAFLVADGQPAWHRLGQMEDKPVDLPDALRLSHCADWNVHKVPIYGQRADKGGMAGRTIPFLDPDGEPMLFGTVRTSPFTGQLEGLGTVGKLWTPVQNEEAAELGEILLNEAGALIHTIGALNGGRQVFMSFKLPEGIMVGGEDAHDLYLVISLSHDGTGAVQFMVTPVRVVCRNTLDMAIARAKRKWSVRHTGDIQAKLETVREGLELTNKYMAAFEKQAEKMVRDPFSDEEMQALLKELIPDPKSEKEGWVQRAEGQRGAIMSLFKNADTCEFGRGTKWAAYNAVAEYTDWLRPGSDERKAREALGIGVNVQYKPKALALLAKG
jgi:phage/plasmid-like protein (TIGR03299 family)